VVVTRSTVLRMTGHRLELNVAGRASSSSRRAGRPPPKTHPEVAPADIHRRPGLFYADRLTHNAVRPVDPAVQPPAQALPQCLRVLRRKAGAQHLLMVGLAVAVGVFRIENLRRRAVENALAPVQDSTG